jgi:YD repeat-containing protein
LLGFIELYNEEGQITGEHLFQEGDEETVTEYFYRGGRLIRAETGWKTREGEQLAPVYTDRYRYSRSASLRAVERVYHEGAGSLDSPVKLLFPHMVLDAAADKDFVGPGLSSRAGLSEDSFIGEGYRVVYTTDERGRILSETHEDNDGKVLSEMKNNWSGDRLASVSWKTGEDERITEYDYDDEGDRIAERNYYNGTLERTVTSEGDQDLEELYMDGVVILRAFWKDGRKISEERVRR